MRRIESDKMNEQTVPFCAEDKVMNSMLSQVPDKERGNVRAEMRDRVRAMWASRAKETLTESDVVDFLTREMKDLDIEPKPPAFEEKREQVRPIYGDYTGSAQSYVILQWCALLYALFALAFYVLGDQFYRAIPNIPLGVSDPHFLLHNYHSSFNQYIPSLD